MRKIKFFMALGLMMIGLGVNAKTQASVYDLSQLTAGYGYTNGGSIDVSGTFTLKGTLASPYYISVADGANITLENVVINGTNNSNYKYAGITFRGDANVYLKGTNKIKGWYQYYPGIFVEPGKTIHIYTDPADPNASLEVSSNGYGAGIGGGYQIDCGSIYVHSGKITATSQYAAAIGSGYQAECGLVYLYGGDIDARCTGGTGCGAAAIGTATKGTVKAIHIKNDVDRLYAKGGDGSPCSIGCGKEGTNESGICNIFSQDYLAPGITENPYTTDRIYTEFVESTNTLTYYYGSGWRNSNNTIEFYDQSNPTAPRFEGYAAKVYKVVIDASMKNAPLTTMENFFYGGDVYNSLEYLTSIQGLSNLNTENVTSMASMFANCYYLTSIDVSSFKTSNVTDMSYMFLWCRFSSIDVSNFDTRNVTNMSFMFACCQHLETIDITNFDMSKVESVSNMFQSDEDLMTIYCNTNWKNLPNLTNGSSIFTGCVSLVGGKGTAFSSDKNKIDYARPDGGTGNPGFFTSKDMIYAEMNATGTVMTIKYGSNTQNAYLTWRPDEIGTTQMTAAEKNKITKVVIDASMANARPTSCRQWFYQLTNLTSITGLNYLNTSECTSMRAMFSGCTNLTSIDLSKFNTEKVSNMSSMFYGCEKLTSIDLSKFNTAKVTTMAYMFQNCKSIVLSDVRSFNISKVTNTSYMYYGCSALQSVITYFDMMNVTNAVSMFKNCSNLETIFCDADWNASTKLTNTTDMFSGCTKLTGLFGTTYSESKIDKTYARPDHGTNQRGYFTPIHRVFGSVSSDKTKLTYYCQESLTKTPSDDLYDPIARNASYLRWTDAYNKITKIVIDPSMQNAPLTNCNFMFYGGYDNSTSSHHNLSKVTSIEGLENLNTANVTSMMGMFSGLDALKTLDLSKLKTSKVTNMATMFQACTSLQTLDLNSFDISSLKETSSMFDGCTALTTIYCDRDWNASSTLSSSGYMFRGCNNLAGGRGTSLDASKLDKSYARPDTKDQKGYFTEDPTYCATPTNLTATNIGTTSVTLTWTPGDREGQWIISCYDEAGQQVWSTSPISTNSYTRSDLIPNKKYKVEVYAICNGTYFSDASDPYYFTTLDVVVEDECKMPDNVELTATSTSATATWTPGAGESLWYYRWLFNNMSIHSGYTDQTSSTITDVTPGEEWAFTVQAVCDKDKFFESEYTEEQFITIPASEGIEDVNSSEPAVKVLRNGVLYIQRNGKIYNAQGALVK